MVAVSFRRLGASNLQAWPCILLLAVLAFGHRVATLFKDSPPSSRGYSTLPKAQAGNITSAAMAEQGKQVPRHDEESGYRYWIYTPASHDVKRKWPLLIFLHGAGESGTNLDDMISVGATGCPPVELANGTASPTLTENFIVASPQTNAGWGDVSKLKSFVRNLIDSADLAVDESRVYCTGVSMGGGGAWLAGATGRFAAVAPVCGAARADPSTLDGVDVWAFHGSNDVVVPASVTDYNVEKLNDRRASDEKAGNPVKYTRYEKSPPPVGWDHYDGHASWMQAYKGDELWNWFLMKSRHP